MDVLVSGFFSLLLIPLFAIIVAVVTLAIVRRGEKPSTSEARMQALEEQVRGLLYRVWTLEQRAGAAAPVAEEAVGEVTASPSPMSAPSPATPEASASAATAQIDEESAAGIDTAVEPPRAPREDLEQRIGARWATWVGVVAILFGMGFFLKWSFDNDLLGPQARVTVGLAAGIGLLVNGLLLHRRRDAPYLSDGLAGLGLGMSYLSLFAAHGVYGMIGAGVAFAAMSAVTALGAMVSVVANRQITAVLTVLGGLLTPVLLTVPEPDERNLLAYLLVLDLLVLVIARFRAWPALSRLAWVGTALLVAGGPAADPDSSHPLSRLALCSALFAVFLAAPLVLSIARRRGHGEMYVLLVVANAAGYFWLVYRTLDAWHPNAEAPYALALAVLYRLVSAEYAAHVPDDEGTVRIHEGIAWTFLTLAIPLALGGRWVTLGWAAEGVALLWAAARVQTPVAAVGGSAALLLAAARVIAVDPWPGEPPVWNLTALVHFLVAVALGAGGVLAAHARSERLRRLTGSVLRALLWLLASLVLSVLLWREPPGLWPATLLTLELALVGWLARVNDSRAWLIATPMMAAAVLARVLIADDLLARRAAASLFNAPLASRVTACAAMGLAGGWLARSKASSRAPAIGGALSGAAGVALLLVLSADWTRYQGRAGFTTQVGLSVLWTLYAAAVLAWGFIRSRASVRYGALALFGLTVLKVFYVDLSAVRTAYRILSFLVLGVVLLGVSLLYQKTRHVPG
jgi:uncharacterized membrane protein